MRGSVLRYLLSPSGGGSASQAVCAAGLQRLQAPPGDLEPTATRRPGKRRRNHPHQSSCVVSAARRGARAETTTSALFARPE